MTFKNTGSVAFQYDWKLIKSHENSNPPEISEVAELISKISKTKNFQPEHSSAERSSITCAKTRGNILPGEIVRTTFIFTPKSVGCESGSWVLTTLPRANIAIDPLGDHCVCFN